MGAELGLISARTRRTGSPGHRYPVSSRIVPGRSNSTSTPAEEWVLGTPTRLPGGTTR